MSLTTQPISPTPTRQDIFIVTTKRDPSDPYHWVIYHGPFIQGTEEVWTFIDITSSLDGSIRTLETRTTVMPVHFPLGEWESRRMISDMLPGDTPDFMNTVTVAVQQNEQHWFCALLDELEECGWITEDKRKELELDIVGE
ncbi:hypothetical protein BDW59DRAFT_157829 [Aspergillus cavernicola]|uniref:Uncharacterized protein n=1 Tax=Aspergillus cavernicola TaxID=176166 RepID=A0ABR4IUR3_9EURO